MLKKPRFKKCYRAEAVDAGVFIVSERGSLLLSEDPLYRISIPLIDGERTTEEIIEETVLKLTLVESQSASEAIEKENILNPQPAKNPFQVAIEVGAKVQYVLLEMKRYGYIVESEEERGTQLTAFCENLNIDYKEASQRLQNTKVAIKSFGNVAAAGSIATLESLGVQIEADIDKADIAVVLTDSYLQEGLDAFNQESLEKSRPWMLVKPVGTLIWLGPIFKPGKTACWQCLAQRLRNNRPSEAFIERHRDNSSALTPPLAELAISQQTGLLMAANEIIKWILLGQNKRLEGAIATYDTVFLGIQYHPIVKRPQCPDCGYLKPQKRPLPVIIGSRKKKFTSDGGHRCFTPEETLAKYRHHISPITGVVRSLDKITDCNGLTHIYRAQHHHLTMFDSLFDLRKNVGGRSGGKGRTDVQAQASGFGEAIERYSGVFQGDEIRIQDSYESLGEKAIHPNRCLNFSATQYRDRSCWNAANKDEFQRVPEPFDESEVIDWTPVWSLSQQDFKYIPTAYCYFGYPKPEKPSCWTDANGCAAGNTIEEAILQGFLELVERDGVAFWWYNRLSRPEVALDSFDEPYFQAVVEYYHSLGRELWVLDLTSDLKIPIFATISRRRDREVEDIILGFGAHFDPKLALQRAITELGQVLPVVLSANPDGSTRYNISAESHVLQWWQTATLANQPYLLPDSQVSVKKNSDYALVWHDDLLKDIHYCQKIVEEKGMEMLVIDQTRPDIGLNVVKVIVPGLRHFWKRLGPGRLYDVPVEMGWLDEPLTEEELNPIPLWL
ncbi:MAG: TOMM precursor leader peptide-binding protein [Oscillatoria sp. SIO1A7]|nr:TOMM precursor leader peptide-binding protein [Oscillatoria sp. SIO1A7]